MKKIILSMEAGLIDDSIGAILSVPFCPLTFCPRTGTDCARWSKSRARPPLRGNISWRAPARYNNPDNLSTKSLKTFCSVQKTTQHLPAFAGKKCFLLLQRPIPDFE